MKTLFSSKNLLKAFELIGPFEACFICILKGAGFVLFCFCFSPMSPLKVTYSLTTCLFSFSLSSRYLKKLIHAIPKTLFCSYRLSILLFWICVHKYVEVHVITDNKNIHLTKTAPRKLDSENIIITKWVF